MSSTPEPPALPGPDALGELFDPEHPWERQPGEPAEAYEALRHWLDLPIGSRTYRAAGAPLKRSGQAVKAWAVEWGWAERTDLWDRYVQAQAVREQLAAQVAANRRYAKITGDLSDKLATAVGNLNPFKIQAKDMARILEVCFRVERLALGMPESRQAVEMSGPGGSPMQLDVSDMTPDQRRAALAAAVEVAASRLDRVNRTHEHRAEHAMRYTRPAIEAPQNGHAEPEGEGEPE